MAALDFVEGVVIARGAMRLRLATSCQSKAQDIHLKVNLSSQKYFMSLPLMVCALKSHLNRILYQKRSSYETHFTSVSHLGGSGSFFISKRQHNGALGYGVAIQSRGHSMASRFRM